MHVHGRALDESLVALLWVFARGIAEEAGAECLSDLECVAAARDDLVFISREDLDELGAHVSRAHHLAFLDEVLETPGIAEAGGFPAIVHVKESEVVAVGIVEFRFLLVCLLLFFLWDGRTPIGRRAWRQWRALLRCRQIQQKR